MLSFAPGGRLCPRITRPLLSSSIHPRLCSSSITKSVLPEHSRPRSPTRSRDVVKKKVGLLVGYDGANYCGLQRNIGVDTVSDVLEKALHEVGGISDDNVGSLEKVKWQVAARTDRGVSAAGNLVSVKLLFKRDEQHRDDALLLMKDRINRALPEHVRIFGINQITGSFSARTACGERWYEYLLPLSAVAGEGNLGRFAEILSQFEGSHLYHNYTVGIDHCIPPRPQANRFLTMATCDLEPMRLADPTGENSLCTEWVRIRVRGQSFMLHQIRKMISMALIIHQSRAPEDAVQRSFRKDTLINIPPAPGAGLFLDSCHFRWYNERYKTALERPVSLAPYDREREEFKIKHIFPSIARRAATEDSLNIYFRTLDKHPLQFSSCT